MDVLASSRVHVINEHADAVYSPCEMGEIIELNPFHYSYYWAVLCSYPVGNRTVLN